MTTPPSLPTIPGLAWSRHKLPKFTTRVASHVSGREVRVPLQPYPLYEFQAVYSGLSSAASPAAAQAGLGALSLQSLMGFFLQMQGQSNTFLYTDPDDNSVSGGAIATANGTTQTFVITRNLGGFIEPVSWVTNVANVYLNGVAQPSSSWLFTAPNSIGLSSAPSAGVAITADFTFAFQCRFLDDQIDFEEFMSSLWKLDSLKFRSVVANTVASPNYPTWYTAWAIGGVNPTKFADFRTEGTSNHYLYGGTTYGSAAAWNTAAGYAFSRSSTKYVTSASGNLASVASNAIPFNHDNSGNPLGVFVEGQSTNLALSSGDLRGSAEGNPLSVYNPQATSATLSGTAPDGTSSATQITATTGTGDHERYQLPAMSSGTYTLSVYAKQGTTNWECLDFGGALIAYFNLGSGALGTVLAGYSAAIVQMSDGYNRCSITGALSGAATTVMPCTANGQSFNWNAAGTENVYNWGEQFELLPFASSYIPTASGTATRAADGYVGSRANPTSLTKFVKAITPPGVGTEQIIWCIDDGTANNQIKLTYKNTSHLHVIVTAGGMQQADLDLGAVAVNTAFAVALCAGAANFAACLNGGSITSSSSGSMPTGMVNDRIGGSGFSAGLESFTTTAVEAEWTGLLATNAQLQAIPLT